MIENQLIGINNPYSPFTEHYECCYMNVLPKILETKNRQLIRTYGFFIIPIDLLNRDSLK